MDSVSRTRYPLGIDKLFKEHQSKMFDVNTWNSAIEAAALIVEPNPHKDEERECKDIAKEIRSLKKKYGAIYLECQL